MKKLNILDKIDVKIKKSIEKFRPKWVDLPKERSLLANNIVIYVEQIGGRNKASELMNCSLSSIDNYRAGITTPDAIDYSILETEAKTITHKHMEDILAPGAKKQFEVGEALNRLSLQPEAKPDGSKVIDLITDTAETQNIIDIARVVLRDIAEAADPDLIKLDPEDFSKTFAEILRHRLAVGKNSEKISNIIEFQAARFSRR